MSDSMAIERSVLERKERDELVTIAGALGLKASARAKKDTIIDQILRSSGVDVGSGASGSGGSGDGTGAGDKPRRGRRRTADDAAAPQSGSAEAGSAEAGSESRSGAPAGSGRAARPSAGTLFDPFAEAVDDRPSGRGADRTDDELAAFEARAARDGDARDGDARDGDARDADARDADARDGDARDGRPSGRAEAPRDRDRGRDRDRDRGRGAETVPTPAELADGAEGGRDRGPRSDRDRGPRSDRDRDRGSDRDRDRGGDRDRDRGPQGQGARGNQAPSSQFAFDDGPGGRRNRRRRRGRERDVSPERDAAADRISETYTGELIEITGLLDLADQGYGYIRASGYLPSTRDVYVPVNKVKQLGLRKGDVIVGDHRPATPQEKFPAIVHVHSVNGHTPEVARLRPRFEDLTPLFPDVRLRLEEPGQPGNMTARIVDLVSPIGKGQRGLIVSPPKAGKTTIMKTIATSIERNNPEVHLMVLLVDERPEEVTDMRRTVKTAEVVASTFDKPSDEHTMIAELAIERAKRLVEEGRDVVIILDGITRLARAYNLAAPATGRIMSGGIDTGALYPPKKFFGAARNTEEGGSLTILATALIETGSVMDNVIFEEFKGTGNMELRLDRKLSEKRVYPAINVNESSTRHEELLFDRKQLEAVHRLRRVLSGLAEDGSAAKGLELLMDRLKATRFNDEFLAEIIKAPASTS